MSTKEKRNIIFLGGAEFKVRMVFGEVRFAGIRKQKLDLCIFGVVRGLEREIGLVEGKKNICSQLTSLKANALKKDEIKMRKYGR